MNINTLNILADAISEVGSWYWWNVKDDMVQVQFCDIMLYDYSKQEKEAHTTDNLAIRFYGHSFAVFLDNLNDYYWHQKLREDDYELYAVDTYEMAFDNAEEAGSLLNDYEKVTVIKDYNGLETINSAKHLLYARCGNVAFIVGGDEIAVLGKDRRYTEEEIETASMKWWDYWKEYWILRGTKDAFQEDYACEISIPVKEEQSS